MLHKKPSDIGPMFLSPLTPAQVRKLKNIVNGLQTARSAGRHPDLNARVTTPRCPGLTGRGAPAVNDAEGEVSHG